MSYRIIPEDFLTRLDRVRSELARRNGYGDVSSHSSISFPDGTQIMPGALITAPVYNTLLDAINYINGIGMPEQATPGVTKINTADIYAIDVKLSAFEAQPRSATSNNDCSALCTGMCVTQCTTSCIESCTGGCNDTCSITCDNVCEDNCEGTCTGTCTSCTGTCKNGCTSCAGGCTGCTGSCSTSCTWACSYTCYGTCFRACASWAN